MAKIVLDGLESLTEKELAGILIGQGHRVTIGWLGAADSADAIFCSGDVGEIRSSHPDLPVIIVTRQPEQGTWLDGMEAGAADYCCGPFETAQLSRLLAGVLGHARGRETKPSLLPRV